jgi:hypothetical protein
MSERIGLAAVGVGQGLAVWLLVEGWTEAHTARALCVGLLTLVAVSAAVFHFAWTGGRIARLVVLAAATGAGYALIATWVGFQLPEEGAVSRAGEHRIFTWVLASLVTAYVLGPFLQIYQHGGRLTFPYDDLFLHSWNNFFVALVGALFTGALWTVLLLWAELFELIGIDFFTDVFTEDLFVYLVTGAAVGFGLALGRESERVVATLRGITLKVFAGLLPLVCFVALLFLAALPVTGLDPLWETDHASHLLLTWVAVTVLFFNAVYQEGLRAEPLPRPARRLVEAGLVAITGFLSVSAWGLWLRIDQYGLTPPRVWAVLLWVVLAAYALGYAGAVLRRGAPWLPAVRPVNRAVAWLVVALGLLAHTPVLDPMGWSARSQYHRLRSGRVAAEHFDYGYLRFELGRAGTERFERLAHLEAHPEIEAIQAGVARAREAAAYWEWKEQEKPMPDLRGIQVLATGTAAPDGLLDAIRPTPELRGQRCVSGGLCTLFAAEISDGPPDEWILALGNSRWPALYVFAREEAGRFTYRGKLQPSNSEPLSLDLGSAIREGRVRSVPWPHRDLLIDETRYRFLPAP